ncbi:DUF2461 domain-containing protein [Massilia arenosa]|uniref:DUF2461 domain-containing protein n=1 Tax=Zemynaea arenosa TaxID=2561931 RepID=A0A4Y9SIP1_9BURK|nr:DUF2461 domain-containing protein [Massilia arenosa]TFW22137.1 DUF2461 domain-containing protein [Massilia arenosa]
MHLRDLSQYLKELSENNTRPWFVMNKPRYDILREEFLQVVTDGIRELGQTDKLVAACNPKKAMFRINRDVRFSNDKSPYKTRFSAGIAPNDQRRPTHAGGPTYYFHIENGMLLYGAGEYIPPPKRLKAIRAHVVNDAPGFGKMLKNKALRTTYGDLRHDEGKLQRPPKGFDPEHPLVEYLKLKSFFVWNEVKLDVTRPERLVPDVVRGFQDAAALVNWLRTVPWTPDEDE